LSSIFDLESFMLDFLYMRQWHIFVADFAHISFKGSEWPKCDYLQGLT